VNLEIEILETGEQREELEAFVAGATDATLFHRLQFLDYNPPGRFDFRHLLFRQNGRLVAVLPAARRVMADVPTLCSPAGASFGGPVFAETPDEAIVRAVVQATVAHARSEGCRRIVISPPPAIYWRDQGESVLREGLVAQGFFPSEEEVIQVVCLQQNENVQWAGLKRAARQAVRRARRLEVRVERSHEWERLYALLAENRRRHGVTPTHSLEELVDLERRVGAEMLLFAAWRQDNLLGGTLIMRCNTRVALNFYLFHAEEAQNDRPNDLLAWESIAWAQREQLDYYDFGTSTIGGVLNEGLWRFKAKFGARDHPRPTYTMEMDA